MTELPGLRWPFRGRQRGAFTDCAFSPNDKDRVRLIQNFGTNFICLNLNALFIINCLSMRI